MVDFEQLHAVAPKEIIKKLLILQVNTYIQS